MKLYRNDKIVVLNVSDFAEIHQCPWCGGEGAEYMGYLRRKLVVRDLTVIVGIMNDYGLKRCSECGLVYKTYFTTPVTEVALQELWNAGEVNRWHCAKSRGLRAVKALIERTCKELSWKGKIRLADVGSGEGEFLKLLAENFDCFGIELNARLGEEVKTGNGFPVMCANIEDGKAPFAEMRCDVVTAFDVFEHFSWPASALRNIHGLVEDDGLVFIETGDVDSYPARRGGPHRWWYAEVLEHKIFWSGATIAAALKAHGFRVIRIIRKPHKGQQLFNPRLWLKWCVYGFSRRLYARLTKVPPSNLRPPKLPWQDHILVVARKQSVSEAKAQAL